MAKQYRVVGAILALGSTGAAHAAPFTPTLSDYAFSGTEYTIGAAANAFFATAWGINFTNAALVKTFAGIAVANGPANSSGTFQTGRITFLDSTDTVQISYLTLGTGTYQAFDSSDHRLDTSTVLGNGVSTLHSVGLDYISYVTFSGDGGNVTIFGGTTYDFDGTTGGGNTDLPTAAVPEAHTYGLMLAGLGVVGAVVKRKRQNRFR